MTPTLIPSIVAARWREALADPTIPRWRSLTQMLSEMVVNGSIPPVLQRTAMAAVCGRKPASALYKPTRKSFSYLEMSPKI
jgi:hypothetical protein